MDACGQGSCKPCTFLARVSLCTYSYILVLLLHPYWRDIFKITNLTRLQTLHVTIEPRHDKTNKVAVHPAKTQISLGIRPVWSESSLCAQWAAKDPRFLHADSEDSDQTGRMSRLIWVFAGRTATLLVLSWGGSILMDEDSDEITHYVHMERALTAVTYEHICMCACGCYTNRNSSEFAFSTIHRLFSARKL